MVCTLILNQRWLCRDLKAPYITLTLYIEITDI